MTHIQQIQIGDVVRVREPIVLMPLDPSSPDEIPAGIFGEVTELYDQWGDTFCQVHFHEPYEYANEIPLRADMLEIMFRFSLN